MPYRNKSKYSLDILHIKAFAQSMKNERENIKSYLQVLLSSLPKILIATPNHKMLLIQ